MQPIRQTDTFAKPNDEVMCAELCTHCDTCVGISDGQLEMQPGSLGPMLSSVEMAQLILIR